MQLMINQWKVEESVVRLLVSLFAGIIWYFCQIIKKCPCFRFGIGYESMELVNGETGTGAVRGIGYKW